MSKHELTIINTQGMMKKLVLDFRDQSQIRFGRDIHENEVILEDRIVSRSHGMFRVCKDKIYYCDNDSTNGTYVENYNYRKLLRKKDGFIQLSEKTILKIGDLKHPDKMIIIIYRISDNNETWKKKELENSILQVGRDETNDIVLKHPGIWKKHFKIICDDKGAGLFARGNGSGVTVNGETVDAFIRLKDKDIIQVLGYQLIYSSSCIYYLDEIDGIYLKACNINKFVGKGKVRKQILHEVNCEIKGNEFVAIIGGSGAGKSTLMNAISGFDSDFLGHVYCNGIDLIAQYQNIKEIIGYVPQQDIIYENLTLKKMLYYTAKMKMPDDTSKAEIENRIKEVLGMVELTEHQNTFIRKLSGGQKKRASIAVELLADPKLFFLDEPTSGLDPGTEKSLMQTLNSLAKKQGKTIVMVTHTTQNLHLCDKIIFMGPGGKLCFCGSVDEAKRFFETDDLVNIYNMLSSDASKWEKEFKLYDHIEHEGGRKLRTKDMKKGRKVSPLNQFLILAQRYKELIINDRTRFFILLMQPLLIGILLYIVADENVFEIYESTKSMLFALSCSGIWIGLFDSIQEVCKERVILKREYMANLKLPGYVMSKFLILSVLGCFQAIILSGAFLVLVGAEGDGLIFDSFHVEIFVIMWMTILASIALGLLISSLVKSSDKAMTIAPFALIIQLLFSGILFNLEGAGEWISYCTVSRWSVEGLGSISNLNALDLKMHKEFPMIVHEEESFFEATSGHLFGVIGILFVMVAFCLIVGMISLRNVSKDSR